MKNIKLGPVSTEVRLNVANGIDIVVSTASADELKVGSKASAVIKASSVMVGVEHA